MEDALAWARREFGGLGLPDIRLRRRLGRGGGGYSGESSWCVFRWKATTDSD